MKLLTLIYDSAVEGEVTELLEEQGIKGYTKSFDAQGQGGTGRKLNDSIWPGSNNILLVALAEEAVAPLMRRVRELQNSFRKRPGVTALLQDVELLP